LLCICGERDETGGYVEDARKTYPTHIDNYKDESTMKHKSVILVVLMALPVFAFMIVPSYASMSVIRGTVSWFDQYGNLHPLAWAQVTATGEGGDPTVTSSTTDGSYIMWVAPGVYNLSVSLEPGFTPQSQMVAVSDGGVVVIDFELEPSGEPIPEYPAAIQPVMLVVATLAAAMVLRRRRPTLARN